MSRLFRFIIPLAAVAAFSVSVPGHAQDAAADSARAALQAELDALLQELGTEAGSDPFLEEGRVPDLVVVSTHTVVGEVAPCG